MPLRGKMCYTRIHFLFLSMNISHPELRLNPALQKAKNNKGCKTLDFGEEICQYLYNEYNSVCNLRHWVDQLEECAVLYQHSYFAEKKSGFCAETRHFPVTASSSQFKACCSFPFMSPLYISIYPDDKVTTKPVMFFTSECRALTSYCTFSINSNGSGGLLSTSIKEMRERPDFTIPAFKV